MQEDGSQMPWENAFDMPLKGRDPNISFGFHVARQCHWRSPK